MCVYGIGAKQWESDFGCGISHCNAKFEKLRSEHAHIVQERIGPFWYARDAHIDIQSR